jgi:hypothetical protein
MALVVSKNSNLWRMMQPCPLFRPAQHDAGNGVSGRSSCRSIIHWLMAVLIQERPMLHNSEINNLEARLVRQARISRIVLMSLSALALVAVLAQLLSALSI